MEEEEHKPAEDAKPEAATGTPAAAPETLEEAWKALAESESKAPRLSSAIAQAVPVPDGDEIRFEVGNAAQKEWIDRNCRIRLEAFLQRRLGRPEIRLVVTVKKVEDTGRGMYMPSDKAKYLQETSPEYNGLRTELGLEVS